MSQLHFIIDMARCIGCYTCSIACKDRAQLPDALDLLRVETLEGGRYPTPSLAFRVVHCFHCQRPPCVEVCPAGALVKSPEGPVLLSRAACVGCGDCLAACPFGALAQLPDGRVIKCDACVDELAAGREPTCVRACPVEALSYAPLGAVPQGRVADADFDAHGVGPAVCYLRQAPRP